MSKGDSAAKLLQKQWGKNVKRRRLAQRWTQAELADLIGTGQATVSRIESGDLCASTDLMIRIGLAFGEDPGTIFDWPLGILAIAAREVAA